MIKSNEFLIRKYPFMSIKKGKYVLPYNDNIYLLYVLLLGNFNFPFLELE
jgi:hypothetical protein